MFDMIAEALEHQSLSLQFKWNQLISLLRGARDTMLKKSNEKKKRKEKEVNKNRNIMPCFAILIEML